MMVGSGRSGRDVGAGGEGLVIITVDGCGVVGGIVGIIMALQSLKRIK